MNKYLCIELLKSQLERLEGVISYKEGILKSKLEAVIDIKRGIISVEKEVEIIKEILRSEK